MGGSVDIDTLSSEAVDQVDAAGELHDILDLPEHLRDALWRVDSATSSRGTRLAGSSWRAWAAPRSAAPWLARTLGDQA